MRTGAQGLRSLSLGGAPQRSTEVPIAAVGGDGDDDAGPKPRGDRERRMDGGAR